MKYKREGNKGVYELTRDEWEILYVECLQFPTSLLDEQIDEIRERMQLSSMSEDELFSQFSDLEIIGGKKNEQLEVI
jgi:hypothetical protein